MAIFIFKIVINMPHFKTFSSCIVVCIWFLSEICKATARQNATLSNGYFEITQICLQLFYHLSPLGNKIRRRILSLPFGRMFTSGAAFSLDRK